MTKPKYNNETDSDLMYDNETKEPSMFRVIILNDDYTPMDFVIYVLVNIFKHDEGSAHKIMLDIHKKGSGLGGVYTFEIAETKSIHMNQLAIENKYPLKSIVEEDV
jgi:ATP-dependent Clp protease adaptor protein ClpS